jgi:hypothetical protein
MSIDDATKAFADPSSWWAKVSPQSLYGVERRPWVFSTAEVVSNAASITSAAVRDLNYIANVNSSVRTRPSENKIIWAANPKSVSWQINQRAVETKNKSGTVLHVWRRKWSGASSDFDDPKITINFNGGSFMPIASRGYTDASVPPSALTPDQISPSQFNFYQFLSLVDQQKITKSGQPNYIYILYRSRVFPSLILKGFFDPQMVVQFQDDSMNPATVSGWSATFTVYETQPSIAKLSQLLEMFKAEGLTGF